jgi:predicted RNA-binding protein YlxR (DUF448 family)
MGCGGRAPQAALIRLTRNPGGGLDLSGARTLGRSGYLHHDEVCWKRFTARKGMLRSLRCNFDKVERMALIERIRHKELGGSPK